MQFFLLKFAITSVKKIYSKMWELWPFVYFINFQRRQIQARNQHFSGEKKPTVAWVKISEKNANKNIFSGKQIERNLFCH